MEIHYSGEAFDPRQTDNILSLKLVENAAEAMTYTPIQAEGFTNSIHVTIK